jgi:hypothetical protein
MVPDFSELAELCFGESNPGAATAYIPRPRTRETESFQTRVSACRKIYLSRRLFSSTLVSNLYNYYLLFLGTIFVSVKKMRAIV